jgi:hypothetical protein
MTLPLAEFNFFDPEVIASPSGFCALARQQFPLSQLPDSRTLSRIHCEYRKPAPLLAIAVEKAA